MKAPGNPEVLIVEAREDYRAKLRAMLTKIGCVGIEAVADGQEALKLLESHADGFGLVVCDLDIGGMDGLEFIRHASRLGVGGLVLYSKHDDAVRSSAEWMARAYKAPLLGVLGVPFTLAALDKLVGRLHIQRTVYSDVVAQHGPDNADRAAVEELEFALEAQQFVPYYQPKVCLATGALRGAEVLARWEHPELGLLAPVHFVALMEEVNLIEPLTHQILDQAGRHAVEWARRGLDTHLAINVSPLTLEREHCARDLLSTIARAGAQPSQFTFEITEKAFAQDATTVLENVLRLRMKGCGISVDDFGTGYSSLQQLNRSPITELKLDRSFVRRIATNSKAASIIESTLDLAAKLKLKTVAEGIDCDDQRRWLAQLGCQIGQGYLFAKPMDRDSFFDWCIEKQRLAA
jgi:EAL domain-containing protein (putative c-di-GMP-specific phosphodiesterase class I)/DNA-binding NarL/FixJ family response regulator